MVVIESEPDNTENVQMCDEDHPFNEDPPSSPSMLVIDLERCSETEIFVKKQELDCDDNCFLEKDVTSSQHTPVMTDDEDDDGIYSFDTETPSSQLTVVNSDNHCFSSSSPVRNDALVDCLYSEELDFEPESPTGDLKDNFYDLLLNIEENHEAEQDDQSELYEDLLCKDHLDEKEHTKNIQEKYQKVVEQNKSLMERVEKMAAELLYTQKKNSILITNISSLYQTAKLEIERKDMELGSLRRDFDSLVFRRKANPNANIQRIRNSAQANKKDFVSKSPLPRHPSRDKLQTSKRAAAVSKQVVGETGVKVDNEDVLRLQNYSHGSKSKVKQRSKSASSEFSNSKLNSHAQVNRAEKPSESCLTPENVTNETTAIIIRGSLRQQDDLKDSRLAIMQDGLIKTPPRKSDLDISPSKTSQKAEKIFPENAVTDNEKQTNMSTPRKKYSPTKSRTSPRKKANMSRIGEADRNLFTPKKKYSPACRTSPRKKANVSQTGDTIAQRNLFKSEEIQYQKTGDKHFSSKEDNKKNCKEQSSGLETGPAKAEREAHPQKKEHREVCKISPRKKRNSELGTACRASPRKKSNAVLDLRHAETDHKKLKSEHRVSPRKKLPTIKCRTSPRKRTSSNSRVSVTEVRHKLLKPDSEAKHQNSQTRATCRMSPRKKANGHFGCHEMDKPNRLYKGENEPSPERKRTDCNSEKVEKAKQNSVISSSRNRVKNEHQTSPERKRTKHSLEKSETNELQPSSENLSSRHRDKTERVSSPERKKTKLSLEKTEKNEKLKRNSSYSSSRNRDHSMSSKNDEQTSRTSSRLKLMLKYQRQNSYRKDDYYTTRKLSLLRSASVARSVSMSLKKDITSTSDKTDRSFSRIGEQFNRLSGFSRERNKHGDKIMMNERTKQKNVCEKTSSSTVKLPRRCSELSKDKINRSSVPTKTDKCSFLSQEKNSILSKDFYAIHKNPEKYLRPKTYSNNTVHSNNCDKDTKCSVSLSEAQQKCKDVNDFDDFEEGEILSD